MKHEIDFVNIMFLMAIAITSITMFIETETYADQNNNDINSTGIEVTVSSDDDNIPAWLLEDIKNNITKTFTTNEGNIIKE